MKEQKIKKENEITKNEEKKKGMREFRQAGKELWSKEIRSKGLCWVFPEFS